MTGARFAVCRCDKFMQNAAFGHGVVGITALAQFAKLPFQCPHGLQPRPHPH